jgi:hypothetical protein
MLKKRIFISGSDARRVRKPIEEVINHRLVETAAKGDFKAIKLINELVIMHDKYQLVRQPSPAEVQQQLANEEEARGMTQEQLAESFAAGAGVERITFRAHSADNVVTGA